MDTANGKLGDIATLLKNNKDWHGPVRDDGCSGCHAAHGGKNFRLLAEAYPPKFYAPFNPDNYTLCFTCHEASLVTEQNTRTLTEFRDGDRNLHYLHVNKADRGRTCRACHDVHASPNPRHIRDSVPYGQWDMPVNFQKSETGGSCAPGCHAKAAYDNQKKP
jgi:predicted CXXCH cytochrome family protein